MGNLKLQLGFDKSLNRITIDGKPYGEPVLTRFQRLMMTGSTIASIWASMPKPDAK